MAGHHPFSPSSLSSLLECSGRFALGAVKSDEESEAAAAGTLCHEAAYYVLATDRQSAHEVRQGLFSLGRPGRPRETWQQFDFLDLTEELADLVDDYVDYVRALPGVRFYEQRLDLSRILPGYYGTADVVSVHEEILADGSVLRTLHIADGKFGRIRVFAFQNPQLGAYAIGAIAKALASHGPVNRVVLHIVQPRIHHYDTWEVELDWLDQLVDDIRRLSVRVMLGEAEFNPGEIQCEYCPAAGKCHAQTAWIAGKVTGFQGRPLRDLQMMTPEQLGVEVLPYLDAIKNWVKAASKVALAYALADQKVTGHKLVRGMAKRRWKDERSAGNFLRQLGLPSSSVYRQKLIGIGEAEKLAGVAGRKKLEGEMLERKERLGEYIERPQGGIKLVPESDARPEVTGGADLSEFDDFDENDEYDENE